MIGPTQQEFVYVLGTKSLLVRDPNAGSKFNFGAFCIYLKCLPATYRFIWRSI